MSVTVDVNILVYADNQADPAHGRARGLLSRLATERELFVLFWPVLLGYLRIVTKSGIVPSPLPVSEAMRNVDALLALPHVRAPGERDGFWRMYQDTAGEQTRGDVVTDAHIATLMRQHEVRTIYTRDRDFRRFDGIQPVDPFA